jgi:glycosyltransferase involved in cell wall biosynthesis
VIGGFGFLRPYKGVLTAIRVVAALRDKYPDIRYRGWHAMYDNGESTLHLAECLAEAARLGVADRIEIDTTFHSLEEIISNLRACDAVMLPYAVTSEEGASAAVNCALAAGRATIVSEARIFCPVSQAVRVVPGGRVEDYRDAIHEVLSKPSLREGLEHAARVWAEQYSYANAAQRILELGCAA